MSASPHRLSSRRSAVALLTLGLLAIAAFPPTAAAGPLLTGITNLHTDNPLAFERTRDAGARLVRIPLDWEDTAPATRPGGWQPSNPSSPGYDWGDGDAAVSRATLAGLTPVLQVDDAPRWAQRCTPPPSLPAAICDPDPAQLAAFATAAARRYNGRTPGLPRVRHWQALNEPNLSLFFFPQFDTARRALSPGLYRTLLNAFHTAVKTVDPSNLVLAAGLGPIARPPFTIGPMRFARELLCMKGRRRPRPARGDCGGGVHFDIFAIHPYTTGGPTHRGRADDVQLGDLAKLRALLRAADRAGRIKGRFRRTPLWITEFSWDSKPPDPGGLPMKIAMRWTAEALYRAWGAGVTHFFWYSLADEPRDSGRPFSQTIESGLYFRGATLAEDRPKPLLKAFRFPFVAYPGRRGLLVWGRTPSGRGGSVRIEIRGRGGWRKLAVRRAARNGIVRARLRSRYGLDKRGAVRARVGGRTSVPFSMRPVRDFRHPPFG
jgi:hypothetical protein